jgi:hypothetical protein
MRALPASIMPRLTPKVVGLIMDHEFFRNPPAITGQRSIPG